MEPEQGAPTSHDPRSSDEYGRSTPDRPDGKVRVKTSWLSKFSRSLAILLGGAGALAVVWAFGGYALIPIAVPQDLSADSLWRLRVDIAKLGIAGVVIGSLFLLLHRRYSLTIGHSLESHACAMQREIGRPRIATLFLVSLDTSTSRMAMAVMKIASTTIVRLKA